jgi:DNA-binding SARP family transcriptional activator
VGGAGPGGRGEDGAGVCVAAAEGAGRRGDRDAGAGYRLAAGPGQVDAARFEALCGEGRRALAAGDPAGAKQRLGAALGLWRGEPLAEFTYERFAQGEIGRLRAARLAAAEDRIEAELALGAGGELIGELESLVAASPLAERPRGS